MRYVKRLTGLAAIGLTLGCSGSDAPLVEPDLTLPVYANTHGSGSGASRNFSAAPMKGRYETPPVETNAAGTATFHLSKDGTALEYKLIVANIENVTQAHIHIGPPGVAGPVVVFLFGFVAGGVTENGVLAQGTITQANLIARPAIGFNATMAQLLQQMRSGNAYVNVHTVRYPAGEIRGQIH